MLFFITASLAIGTLGVNAGYPQCDGTNPNPTGQGFGAIYNAQAGWSVDVRSAELSLPIHHEFLLIAMY
jgi:hypothetical protein